MYRPSSLAALVFFLSLFARPVAAQEPAYVAVETNLPEAIVYADSLALGPAADRVFAIPATARRLRLVAPSRHTWSIAPVEVALEPRPGDTVAVAAPFPHHYLVESVPFGAAVHLETEAGWTRLGDTPLLYESERPLEGRLVVERAGYVLQRLEPGREVWNDHHVMLVAAEEPAEDAASISWKPPRKTRRWIDYAAIGTAVAAGALAVHYKFKADNLYDDYERTGDPSLRPRIERLDLYSGVALGTMQVGVGVFAIRLALR